jgi:hypothetical protein
MRSERRKQKRKMTRVTRDKEFKDVKKYTQINNKRNRNTEIKGVDKRLCSMN